MNNAKQIAEKLAKCAADVAIGWTMSEDEWQEYKDDKTDYEGLQSKILQSIPLVELLECAETLKHNRGPSNMPSCDCRSCVELRNLDTKLKQLLGEEIE